MTKKIIIYLLPLFIIFVLLSLFEPWIYRTFYASKELERLKDTKFTIIAHKGASGLAPENTISAFKKALEIGVDIIELDVRHTKDEQIVVFHDQFIDRLARDSSGSPVSGDIHDFTYDELLEFEVGSWFDTKYSDQKIPLLKQVLDTIAGRCDVLIEIKHMDHPHYHDFAEKLVNIIHQEPKGYQWIILQSYENDYIEEVHKLDTLIQTKQILIGEDSMPLIAFYIETKIHLGRSKEDDRMKALNLKWTTLSPRRVFRIHARGYEVFAYVVNDKYDMIKMLNAGVDGIITDYPDRLIELKNEIATLGQSK